MENILKKINKLKKLGMSSQKAMLFVRSIAYEWYLNGHKDGMHDYPIEFENEISEPFDTQFSKLLTPKK